MYRPTITSPQKRRPKNSWSEIFTVKLYFNRAPMMMITQKDGKTITQSLGIMNNKKMSILLGLFQLHEIPIYKSQSQKSEVQ
jgi:hypothetical protein